MVATLRALRKKVVIGVVGGSDFVKVAEQLTVSGSKGVLSLWHRLSLSPYALLMSCSFFFLA